MLGYAMYLRKSRADMEAEMHGEGETLLRHEHILMELAQKMGLSVTSVYREIVSGESIESRPEIKKLLAEVEQGKYAGVLVVDIDRLARGDTVDQGIIARTFKFANTKIITPKKIYDPSSEYDEEYFEFELFMARREYKLIARRIQRGRLASVNDGKYIGSTAPYGYDRYKLKGKGWSLRPNDEADIVKQIYQMYLSGNGMMAIANTLNDMHIPTRTGNPWRKYTVADILANPVYTGKIRWSYRPYIKQNSSGTAAKRVVNDNCMLVPGLHEALISEEDFEKAQELRKKNYRPPLKSSLSLQNPLTGLIYCKLCGNRMTRLGKNARNKYDTIKCTTRGCPCVSAPIYLVEELTIGFLKNWLLQYKMRLSKDTPNNGNEQKLCQKSINALSEDIKKIDAQIAKTYDLLEQGIYSVEVFTERNKTLTAKRSESEDKQAELKQSLSDMQNADKLKYDIIPKVEHVIDTYDLCTTAEQKNNLLKSVINRIDYVKKAPNRRGNVDNVNFALDISVIVDGNTRKV